MLSFVKKCKFKEVISTVYVLWRQEFPSDTHFEAAIKCAKVHVCTSIYFEELNQANRLEPHSLDRASNRTIKENQ